MFESEQTSVASDDENEEKSVSEGNESETDEEEDGSDSGVIPKLNIKGPGKVNIKNSQGVKIGSTIKMTLKVDKMIVQNEANQLPDTAAIAGIVVNRLTEVLQANAANQYLPALLDCPSSSNSRRTTTAEETDTRIMIQEFNEKSADSESSSLIQNAYENETSSVLSHSAEVTSEKNESSTCHHHHDNWWNMLLNDEKLQSELVENVSIELNSNDNRNNLECEGDVSVYSLIDEFVQNINNFIIVNNEQDIYTPEFNIEIDFNIFKRKMKSGRGLLTGYQPLVRENKIDIEVIDNLIYLKIPLYLENLKVTFEDFSFGISDITISGVTANISRTDICIIITAAPNVNGCLDTDFTKELSFQDVKIDFTGNVAEQAFLLLVKNKVKKLIRQEYMENVISILDRLLTDVMSNALLYDFCCKLISLYDIG